MGQNLNYNKYAQKYAHTRWAVPWIAYPLISQARHLPPNAVIVEIGCGTGNYIIALSKYLPQFHYKAFDISEKMLDIARSTSNSIEFCIGDAESRFPYGDKEADLAFAVDVIHHIVSHDVFFQEAFRVLKPGGNLLIITDSEEDIQQRSLTRFFPDILKHELDRYPKIEVLHHNAISAGLAFHSSKKAEGYIDLDDDFISKLKDKCASALHIISEKAHEEGLNRVMTAQKMGEKWHSCYTILRYEKPSQLVPIQK